MRGFALPFLALAVVSCAPEAEQDQTGLHKPAELEPLRQAVLACVQDVEVVPIEHSEHCVIAGETMLDFHREDCEASQSADCLKYEIALNSNLMGYQIAITTSLLRYGAAPEVKEASEKTLHHLVYFDGMLLRGLFEQCLDDEEAALKEAGFRQVHVVMPIILAEGQKCIREGYPDFEIAEI